jgi:hypothetical protein
MGFEEGSGRGIGKANSLRSLPWGDQVIRLGIGNWKKKHDLQPMEKSNKSWSGSANTWQWPRRAVQHTRLFSVAVQDGLISGKGHVHPGAKSGLYRRSIDSYGCDASASYTRMRRDSSYNWCRFNC